MCFDRLIIACLRACNLKLNADRTKDLRVHGENLKSPSSKQFLWSPVNRSTWNFAKQTKALFRAPNFNSVGKRLAHDLAKIIPKLRIRNTAFCTCHKHAGKNKWRKLQNCARPCMWARARMFLCPSIRHVELSWWHRLEFFADYDHCRDDDHGSNHHHGGADDDHVCAAAHYHNGADDDHR